MNQQESKSLLNPGAVHADLVGGTAAFRFRPNRITAKDLKRGITVSFVYEKKKYTDIVVANISPTGLGLEPVANLVFSPGATLEELEVLHSGMPVWSGEATVVYHIDHPMGRVGIRFTSGLFDLRKLQLTDLHLSEDLEQLIHFHQQVAVLLPDDWKSAVSGVRQYLSSAKRLVEEASQKAAGSDRLEKILSEKALIEAIFHRWGAGYYGQLRHLHELSKQLNSTTIELARTYAAQELLPLLYPCPMHSRAHDKPRGYAGDYQLITLYFREDQEGATPYARFLHYVAQHYSLAHTVIAREKLMREAVQTALSKKGHVRIVSLACGPAIELQKLFATLPEREGTAEFFLIDQDENALQHCYHQLNEVLLSRRQGPLKVELHCLHFSVRQLLSPKTASEERVANRLLDHADLIYSAGLFDYLPDSVAKTLSSKLYSLLAPGGRLLIGNLRESPETSWLMEYVLSWHLEYRTPKSMLTLGCSLAPNVADVGILFDATGDCMFLDARKPSVATQTSSASSRTQRITPDPSVTLVAPSFNGHQTPASNHGASG